MHNDMTNLVQYIYPHREERVKSNSFQASFKKNHAQPEYLFYEVCDWQKNLAKYRRIMFVRNITQKFRSLGVCFLNVPLSYLQLVP